MTYFHRVQVFEESTSILPPRRISAGIPVWLGTAPAAKSADFNKPHLHYTLASFAAGLGEVEDNVEAYGLCEAAKVQFQLYRVAPGIFIPVAHETEVTAEAHTMAGDPAKITLDHLPVKAGSEAVKDETGTTTYVRGEDYTIDYDTGQITRLADGDIGATDPLKVDYTWFDPATVDADDVIGGVESGTGLKTGLELVHEILPRFGLMPGTIAAPGWSQDSTVAAAMVASAVAVNGLFRAFCAVDLPISVTGYQGAQTTKTSNNLTDPAMAVCWPQVLYGSESHWLSTHLACLMAQVDLEHSAVPYKSPSNERLQITGAHVAGAEVWLGHDEAEYLNGQGIVTALNQKITGQGWTCFGNRTGAYPAITDPKDAFIPIRRMFNWADNTLILTTWQRLDFPIRKRLIETIVFTHQKWLDGLTARGFILGGEIGFESGDNPETDVIDGIIKFRTRITPPPPAREIDFYTEFDPSYVSTIFGE